MQRDKHIKLLLITDLYPRGEGDMRGIFVRDFARSIESYCDITVFNPIAFGDKQGLREDVETPQIRSIRYTASENKKTVVSKPFIYGKLINNSIKICRKIGRFDLIHAHGSVVSGRIALKTAGLQPVLITEHTGPFSGISSRPLLRWASGINMRHAEAVLSVSAHLQMEIRKSGICPQRMEVTGNPVDDRLFTLAPPAADRPQNILFVSRLDVFKGGLKTLKAFHRIAAKHPSWTLLIAGEGEEKQAIAAYIHQNRLDAQVRLTGFLSRKNLQHAFHKSAFFILPSKHESFGLILAEAMCCGLPVIGPDVTAPPEIIEHDSGMLIRPEEHIIATALDDMIHHYKTYNRIKIREKTVQRFGMHAFGKRIFHIYKSVLPCAE